ncbi:glycosyl hydrolase family protein [Niallia nealsonii AAU1]|nr:glycosyl hydrolase family protein [Niallia nealsonii AAU1]
MDKYKDSGELKHSLYKSLSNKLKQSKQHLDKGREDQAAKFLRDMIKLINNDKNKELPADKKEILKADLEKLIEQL